MRFKFRDEKLRLLYKTGEGMKEYGPEVTKAFIKVISIIRSAKDERDFYNLKSLHFESLQARQGQKSLRLNKQWRLIITIEQDKEGKLILIIEIEDYH